MRSLLLLIALGGCSSELPSAPKPAAPMQPGPSHAQVTQLAVGSAHTCALHADGAVSCWGSNHDGQLGVPKALVRSLHPIDVPGARGAVELTASGRSTCIRRADDVVLCWGQLGIQSDVEVPSQVTDHIAQLAGRCFRRRDGGVECLMPNAQVVRVAGIERAVHMASWETRGCVARDDGAVQCWIDVDDRAHDIVISNAVEVMADRAGMCARTSRGDVQCWPIIDNQVFDGPTLVFSGARGIVGGDLLICARTSANVVCWQRGDATKRVIEGVPPDAPIATGLHTCIAKRGREVACWGTGLDGELGNGWWRRRPVPSRVPGLANVVELGSGHRTQATCARLEDRSVSCWGFLPQGARPAPLKMPVANVRGFGGSTRSAMIDADGRLYEADITGYGEHDPTFAMKEYSVVSASDQCFVNVRGRVACWQLTGYAQSASDRYEVVPTIEDAVQVASHGDQGLACVRHRDGRVSCFDSGSNRARVVPISEAIDLAVTDLVQCAIRADRSLWCWGSTQSDVFSPRPVPVDVAPQQVPVGEVAAMSLARDTICVARTNGTVACWGRNEEGQLGDGTFMSRSRPADVIGISDAIDVQLGHEFACALHRTGEVSCWGATERGQIGTYAMASVADPTPVVWP